MVVVALAQSDHLDQSNGALAIAVQFIIMVTYGVLNFVIWLLFRKSFGKVIETPKDANFRTYGTILMSISTLLGLAAALARYYQPATYYGFGSYWAISIVAAMFAAPAGMLTSSYVLSLAQHLQQAWRTEDTANEHIQEGEKIIRQFLIVASLNWTAVSMMIFILPVWAKLFPLAAIPAYYWSIKRCVVSSYELSAQMQSNSRSAARVA